MKALAYKIENLSSVSESHIVGEKLSSDPHTCVVAHVVHPATSISVKISGKKMNNLSLKSFKRV